MPHVEKLKRGWISGALLVSACILLFALRPVEGCTVLQWTEAHLATGPECAPVGDSTHDESDTVSSAYDGLPRVNLGYDGSPALAGVEEERHISARMLALGNFAEFLAAEGTFFENMALKATQNPNSTEVVLGKFNPGGVSYIDVLRTFFSS